jgi:hypothetical protein
MEDGEEFVSRAGWFRCGETNPSPDPRRLEKAPWRATLSPRERATGSVLRKSVQLKMWAMLSPREERCSSSTPNVQPNIWVMVSEKLEHVLAPIDKDGRELDLVEPVC